MNIAWCVAHLHPDLVPGEDWRVVDHSDGHGPRLLWQTADVPEPTLDELAGAWTEIIRAMKRRELEDVARREIESVWKGAGELSPEMAEKKAVLARVQGTSLTADERAGAGAGRTLLGKLEALLEEVEISDNPEEVMWDA